MKTMAVYYRMYQNKRRGDKYDYWYARAAQPQTVNLDLIAELVQQNCSLKRSDVKAVLTELVEVMTYQLQAGNKVKLDGFGSFKIGLRTSGVKNLADFSVTRNVKSVHLLFLPEAHVGADGKHIKTFLAGTMVKELTDYAQPSSSSIPAGKPGQEGGNAGQDGHNPGDSTP